MTVLQGLAGVAAALVLGGCSATQQHIDLTLRGDLPAGTVRGDRTAAAPRRASQPRLERRATVALPCDPKSAAGCGAGTTPMTIAPIDARLGNPPSPAEVVRRVAPSGLGRPGAREQARAAYADAIRLRHRAYAAYVRDQLAEADWVDISDPDHDDARRYSGHQIGLGLDEAFVAMGDHYAALEWNRFEGHRTVGRRAPAARALARPKERDAVAARGSGRASSGPASAPAPSRGAAAVVPPESAVTESEAPPAGQPVRVAAPADDAPCRRACGLRRRGCLAGCRSRPLSGGGYGHCSAKCRDGELACRGRC